MRKTLLIMAVALLLIQCRKPAVEFPTAEPANTVSMTVTAGSGGKTDISETGAITWNSGDKLYVGCGGKYVGYLMLEKGADTPTGTFSGKVTLTGIPEGDEQTFGFFYLGNAKDYSTELTKGTSATVDVSFAEQNIYNNGGNLENASAQHVGYGSAKGTIANGIVTGINVTLVSKVALARFSFKKGGADYTGALTLSGTNIYNSMTVGFGGSFNHGATSGSISLTGGHGERYVMLVPTGATTAQTLTFTGSAEDGTGDVPGLESNKFYWKESAKEVTLAVPTVNFGTPNLNWSVCNLGATNGETAESWYGDYYQWGGVTDVTSTTINVGWAGCPHTRGTYSSSNKAVFTKYVPKDKASTYGYDGFYDDKTVLDAVDDAATANWGDGWRMPTSAEWQSLYNNNTFEWLAAGATSANVTSFKAVAAGCLVVKGKESSLDPSVYMFLPAAGCRENTTLYSAGSYGSYWSGSLYSSPPNRAYNVYFDSGLVYPQYNINRYSGYTVRPVRPAL